MFYLSKRNPLFLLAVLTFIAMQPSVGQSSQPAKKDWVIVIDAGHGGNDPGAVSGTVKEKDITLALALKLGKQLAALENTKVIYTRETDVAVELHNRPKKANTCKADLFISIHCNASESSKPYGSETFVMGLHRSKANLEVAKTENSVILLEENYNQKYDGFDPNSPESDIIFSLYQNAYLDQSVELASLVQKEFRINAQRFDRGVKQAGFLVLYKTTMPGILVETGFLSNENERKYLVSDAGQKTIAASLYSAVLNYREKVDGVKPKLKNPEALQKKEDEPKKTEQPDSLTRTQPPKEANQDPKINEPSAQKQEPSPKGNVTQKTSGTNAPELYFSVQFLVSAKPKEPADPAFEGLKDVHMYLMDGSYRYVAGYFKNPDDANAYKLTLQKGIYKDAFLVAFHKGIRIPVTEATQLMKK